MKIQTLFSTHIYRARLNDRSLNRDLERESYIYKKLDVEGRHWSEENYFKGYTSYSSVTDLPFRSSTFDALKKWIDGEVRKFLVALSWESVELRMSTCWINIMKQGCHHSAHMHPHSAISGTYFVRVPKGSGGLKFEDPRLGLFMNRPNLKQKAKSTEQNHFVFVPKPGELVLFESWLKHEVPPNRARSDRISVSFNYDRSISSP